MRKSLHLQLYVRLVIIVQADQVFVQYVMQEIIVWRDQMHQLHVMQVIIVPLDNQFVQFVHQGHFVYSFQLFLHLVHLEAIAQLVNFNVNNA